MGEGNGARLLVDVALERGDSEHFAGAFAVATGDDGGMDINEIALLEKLMDRVSQFAARAEDRSEEIRARPQVRNGAQKLQRMPLLLQRVTRVRFADQFNARGAQLPLLACGGRWHKVSLHDRGSAGDKA